MTKNFRTQYDSFCSTPSNPGTRFKVDYVATRDSDGRLELKENGRTDTYAVIQSFRESTDLAVIISRFLSGDTSALSRNPAFYGDVVGVPTNLNDALRVIESAERDFKSLDPEIQQRFENDFGVYVSMMDNPVEFARRFKGEPVENILEGGVANESE